MEDLRDTTLWLTMWSYSIAWQNKFLGEICIPLDEESYKFSDDPDCESPPITCILQDYSNQKTIFKPSLTRKKSTLYFIETEYRKRCSECLSSAPDFLQRDKLKAYSNGSDGETSSSVAKEDADGHCDENVSSSSSVKMDASTSETVTEFLPVSNNQTSSESLKTEDSKSVTNKLSCSGQEEERETDKQSSSVTKDASTPEVTEFLPVSTNQTSSEAIEKQFSNDKPKRPSGSGQVDEGETDEHLQQTENKVKW